MLASLPDRSSSPKITRGHSCTLCQQRKVKCDRQKPCVNCIKARVECVPSPPVAPRRRKRKVTEQDLTSKLARYEQLLKKHGVSLDDAEPAHPPPAPSCSRETERGDPNKVKGILLANRENTRYVENTLWDHLRDEISEEKEALQSSSSDDETNEQQIYPLAENFFVGHGRASMNLSSRHPEPVQIFRLWQTFLVNCNPLIKIFHAPTLQQVILDATSDLENVPKHTEALMFAIYLLAVTSLNNQECEAMFRESRNDLLAKYSHWTQQALLNARFLKPSNLCTLQAFCLYLLAVRHHYDHQSFWILTGTAVRIGQRVGVHRDGAAHGIPPFEAEMRRRTWWQIVLMDGQASKFAGAGFPTWLSKFDTALPLNISDSDLSPTMTEAPTGKDGPSDMMLVRLRAEVSGTFKKLGVLSHDGVWRVSAGLESMAEKDKTIDNLEARFKQCYTQYCDPSIPLHLLCIYMSQTVICSLRLMAHHPRQYPDKGASMPQQEKDMLFAESLKELEIATTCHASKPIQGFLWHTRVHFLIDAFIYVLSELRSRTSGDLVERAWSQVEIAYEQHPEMITRTRSPLYFAMGNLCLKAWSKFEEAATFYRGSQPPRVPLCVSTLRSQRKSPPPNPSSPRGKWSTSGANLEDPFKSVDMIEYTNHMSVANTVPIPATEPLDNGDYTAQTDMPEVTPADWEYWQTLMDGDLPMYSGDVSMCVDSNAWMSQ